MGYVGKGERSEGLSEDVIVRDDLQGYSSVFVP